MNYVYFVMDGRAAYDIDAATVLCSAESLKEARDDAKAWGDTVIVRYEEKDGKLDNPTVMT